MKLGLKSGVAAVALMIAGTAHADIIDFTDLDSSFDSIFVNIAADGSIAPSGTTPFLVATAGVFSGQTGIIPEFARTSAGLVDTSVQTNRYISRTSVGFGVVNDSNGFDTDGQIDGAGSHPNNDVLILTFSESVIITDATFRADNGSGDDFAFGQIVNGVFSQDDRDADTNSAFAPQFTLAQRTGTTFGFGAFASEADYRLESITYEIAPVPLPATGLMLLGALGAGGFVARRKAKQS